MTVRRVVAGIAALLALGGCGATGGATAEEPLLVAAAADLRPVFDELGASFEQATGQPVVVTFGSSGQLAQQLLEGAPYEVFASADVGLVDLVVAAGRGDAASQATYAIGRLVIWSRRDGWRGWTDLADLALDRQVGTVAIANPDHAPYGRAARQAIQAAGVDTALGERLVYGENVADAQRLAATGNADAAVIALSLAVASDERGEGEWTLVEDRLHAPLQQDLVVTATDPGRADLAAGFVAAVGSAQGRAVMRRYGFVLPDDPEIVDDPEGPAGREGTGGP